MNSRKRKVRRPALEHADLRLFSSRRCTRRSTSSRPPQLAWSNNTRASTRITIRWFVVTSAVWVGNPPRRTSPTRRCLSWPMYALTLFCSPSSSLSLAFLASLGWFECGFNCVLPSISRASPRRSREQLVDEFRCESLFSLDRWNSVLSLDAPAMNPVTTTTCWSHDLFPHGDPNGFLESIKLASSGEINWNDVDVKPYCGGWRSSIRSDLLSWPI